RRGWCPVSARLDQRVLAPGLRVTVADLVAVFIDHYRPDEAMTACTACGHAYTPTAPARPSMAVVGPLLTRRRHEAPAAVPERVRQVLKSYKSPAPRRALSVVLADVELLDSAPYRVARMPRQCTSKRVTALTPVVRAPWRPWAC